MEEKATFFDGQVNYASTLMAHFEGKGTLTLMFNRDVVDTIIGDMLFDLDDESMQSTRERALAVFKPLEDAEVALSEDGAQDLVCSQVQNGSWVHFDGTSFWSAS